MQYIGLHDESIASLWIGFICHNHCDGGAARSHSLLIPQIAIEDAIVDGFGFGERLLRLSPQATLGEALCEQGKFEEAKPYLLKAAEPAKSKGMPLLNLIEMQAKSALAMCYLEEGDRSKAIETLTQVRDTLRNMKIADQHSWILDRCEERLKSIEVQE